jgi:hypothetical protein
MCAPQYPHLRGQREFHRGHVAKAVASLARRSASNPWPNQVGCSHALAGHGQKEGGRAPGRALKSMSASATQVWPSRVARAGMPWLKCNGSPASRARTRNVSSQAVGEAVVMAISLGGIPSSAIRARAQRSASRASLRGSAQISAAASRPRPAGRVSAFPGNQLRRLCHRSHSRASFDPRLPPRGRRRCFGN